MRSPTRGWLLVLAALAGCGNYSTEDLRFLAALPRRTDLRVDVPVDEAAAPAALSALTAATATCTAIGEATVWGWARPTSEGLNRGVDFVVGLIDAVRRYPPTWRDEDARGWGPFDDEDHPGREVQIVIARSWPDGRDAAPLHGYRFEARLKGTTAFTPILYGAFVGASAATGSGDVVLDFEALWTLGMEGPDTPHGVMRISYDRASEPATVDLTLDQAGFGVVRFAYGYAGYADGSGAFDYAFRNASQDLLEVRASYDAAGAGRLAVDFTPWPAPTPAGSFRQCFDAAACLVYVDDPADLSCAVGPCSAGDLAACALVPVSPF